MHDANRHLAEHYRGAFNEEFAVPAAEPGMAFVPFIGPGLADVLCEHHERTVNRDNCVSFEGRRLQIPAQTHRCHFIKARVRVHRSPDGRLVVFHGPRKLAEYEPDGSVVSERAPAFIGTPPRASRGRSLNAYVRVGRCSQSKREGLLVRLILCRDGLFIARMWPSVASLKLENEYFVPSE